MPFIICCILATQNHIRLKQLLFIMVLLSSCVFALAQSDDEGKHKRVDFYGYVVTADSLKPIRNTHVISKMAHCGTISNHQGKFHILAREVDTLWVSCIGYGRRLVVIDESLKSTDTLVIRLSPEIITLNEVTVLPFTNYETFKEMLITMPSIKTLDEIERLSEDLEDLWLSRVPAGNGKPTITGSPIQYLYDNFNASARRQARLQRNRRMYNEVLREQGRENEILPDSLDFAVDYNVPISDDKSPKALVPRKKYFKIGQ